MDSALVWVKRGTRKRDAHHRGPHELAGGVSSGHIPKESDRRYASTNFLPQNNLHAAMPRYTLEHTLTSPAIFLPQVQAARRRL
eukprot:1877781-Pleurochrysis_carterae.AAC.1